MVSEYMRLEQTPEKLRELAEQLDQLREARDEYHTVRNGFIHYNRPEKINDITPYIGAEVNEEDLLESGYSLVEYMAETDSVFRELKNAKSVFSKLDDDMIVSGRPTKEWQHEISEYALERQELVRDIFELSEPIDQMDDVRLDLGAEYMKRLEAGFSSYF